MTFSDRKRFADVSSIGQGPKEVRNLKNLVMDFSFCEQLADVSSSGQGLKELRKLSESMEQTYESGQN